MQKRKFNYYKFGIFCAVVIGVIVLIILGITSLIKNINYKKSYEYKFIQVGYSKEEYDVISKNIEEKNYDKLLEKKYDKEVIPLVKEKYFMISNLDKYLEYFKENNKAETSDVIKIINTQADIDWIDTEYDTDTSKNELMLVNRLYGLNKDYAPEDIENLSLSISYSGNKISRSIIENINDLINAGKQNNYTFVVSQGYRSYEDQEKIYNSMSNSIGQSEADKVAARPGHSEYQTGLSFDLQPYNKVFENAFESEEYNWLKENAYKYGFILRLTKEGEEITKFKPSAWRLRYVGEEAAQKIYEENITFEEYYAYYVIGENNE